MDEDSEIYAYEQGGAGGCMTQRCRFGDALSVTWNAILIGAVDYPGFEESLQVNFCMEAPSGVSTSVCAIDVPFRGTDDGHRYEIGTPDDEMAGVGSLARCELTGHWLTSPDTDVEIGPTRDPDALDSL